MAEQDCCGTVVIRGPKGDKGDAGPPGSTQLRVRDPITSDGTGTQGDPYVIGLSLSTDEGNNLELGVDGGLYSRRADGSETSVTAGPGVEVSGRGTTDDPYVITVTAESLGDITSVTGTHGVTTTQDGTDVTVSADISSAAGNQLLLNDDGGLYVAAPTNIGDNTLVVGDGLTEVGTGTTDDPYVLSTHLSADNGNVLVYGSDGGLYVPDSDSGGESAQIGPWTDLPYDTANWTIASVKPQYRLIGDRQAAVRFSLMPKAGVVVNNSHPITLPDEIMPAQSTWKDGVVGGSAKGGAGTVSGATVRFDINITDGSIIVIDQRGITTWIGLDTIYWLD
ncbi:hypothetical protein ACWD2L_00505 [Streptomyces sp. NPDC002754]